MKNVRAIVLQTPNDIEGALFPQENLTSSHLPAFQAEASVLAAQLPNAPTPVPTSVAAEPGATD